MLKPIFTCLITSVYATAAHSEPIRIVTDIPPVHSLVSQVLGNSDSVKVLVDGASSPHDFALKPSQASELQNADMVVFVGHALTPWIEKSVDSLASDAVHLELLDLPNTEKLGFRELEDFGNPEKNHDDLADEHEGHNDSHGHNHEGSVDPHAWMDPDNAVIWLNAIATALTKLDPENADIYAENTKTATEQLKSVTVELKNKLEPVENKPFFMLHDAFQYFEEKFHLHATGTIILADEAQPTPSQLSETKAVFEENAITCVFVEPQVSTKLLASVKALGAKQAILDPLGRDIPLGPMLYETLIRETALVMTNCLSS